MEADMVQEMRGYAARINELKGQQRSVKSDGWKCKRYDLILREGSGFPKSKVDRNTGESGLREIKDL